MTCEMKHHLLKT